MKIKLYQIDAFTDKIFEGNPAAICPLNEWLPDEILQNIALENNLSETGFFVKRQNDFVLRWFTPAVEVDLCGHATLAAGHVIFNYENFIDNTIIFSSRSGILKVKKEKALLVLDFPVDHIQKADTPQELIDGLGIKPIETYRGKDDYMLVYSKQEDIENMKPDFGLVNKVNARGVIVTARGKKVDFVSRFFAPQSGIAEDPVTGSAHTTLTPYWAKKIGKNELTALQVSKRTGKLKCKLVYDRVEIAGQAKTYMIGEIEI